MSYVAADYDRIVKPLREDLSLIPETIQEFELAATDKISEGQTLLASGALSGGIYPLGYAAEMLLKNACDLCLGAEPSAFIGATVNTLTSSPWRPLYVPSISPESKHSILFWSKMLENLRDALGNGFSEAFRGEFVFRTGALYESWWVEMRYRRDRATFAQAIDVLDNVNWLRNNYNELWTV